MCIHIYIYIYMIMNMCVYIYIYIYIKVLDRSKALVYLNLRGSLGSLDPRAISPLPFALRHLSFAC